MEQVELEQLAPNVDSIETKGPPSHEDIIAGYELFHTNVYCPDLMVFKLFYFIDQLLSNQSSRTVIQTMANTLQPGALTDQASLTLTKQFYNVMASTLNLQYGNVLLATSPNAQLPSTDLSNLVKTCLQESHCEKVQDIFQKLGNAFVYFLSILKHL